MPLFLGALGFVGPLILLAAGCTVPMSMKCPIPLPAYPLEYDVITAAGASSSVMVPGASRTAYKTIGVGVPKEGVGVPKEGVGVPKMKEVFRSRFRSNCMWPG